MTDEELLDAVRWTMTHDPSAGYLQSLQWFLRGSAMAISLTEFKSTIHVFRDLSL